MKTVYVVIDKETNEIEEIFDNKYVAESFKEESFLDLIVKGYVVKGDY
jgi:hypothetical protein